MRPTRKAAGRHYERGSVAVEAALVLPILLLFLGLPSVLLAFYFRQYTAAQKAVHDAALYLSTAPRIEMTTAGPDGNFAALTLASKIVAKEMAGIVADGTPVTPDIYCIYRVAATTPTKPCTPAMLRIDTQTLLRFDVGINLPYINPLTGREVEALYISSVASVRYLGN
jgi:Flp pilus assembly protein TadG